MNAIYKFLFIFQQNVNNFRLCIIYAQYNDIIRSFWKFDLPNCVLIDVQILSRLGLGKR